MGQPDKELVVAVLVHLAQTEDTGRSDHAATLRQCDLIGSARADVDGPYLGPLVIRKQWKLQTVDWCSNRRLEADHGVLQLLLLSAVRDMHRKTGGDRGDEAILRDSRVHEIPINVRQMPQVGNRQRWRLVVRVTKRALTSEANAKTPIGRVPLRLSFIHREAMQQLKFPLHATESKIGWSICTSTIERNERK